MDADLIRLVLLGLGACLVAGIWLWDRTQRDRGEPPMVRVREDDDSDDATEWEETDSSEQDVEEDSELDDREPHRFDSATLPDADPREDPADFETPSEPAYIRVSRDDQVTAPETSPARRKPAWIKPAEPVIPAFLMRVDSELLEDAPIADAEPASVSDTFESTKLAVEESLHDDNGSDNAGLEMDSEPPSLTIQPDQEPELPVLELAPEPIATPSRSRSKKTKEAPAKPDAEPVSIRVDEDQFDLDLGFSAVDDQDLQDVTVDLPDLIVQINIVTKGEPFSGEQILAAMDQVEMRSGEHDIFHRYDNRASKGRAPKSLFSLASLVEPGNFPLKKMKDFSSPGLTLFTQLPGPRDGLLIYSDMLYVAERLARLLDARLKDDSRSTLTKQTIEHTRERIAEHKRQITLKLRQAADQQRGRR